MRCAADSDASGFPKGEHHLRTSPLASYFRGERLCSGMGLFNVRAEVFSIRDSRNARELEFVVNTGATYPVIPREVADQLGVELVEPRIFTLADGTRVTRDLGHVGFAYEGRRCISMVVIGEDDDVPLLAATALEQLGFEADPVAKTLRPARQYLLVHA